MIILQKRQVLNGVKTEPPKTEQVCRIFTSCEAVALFECGGSFHIEDKCHRNAIYCENLLFCLHRRPPPYVGQVSQKYHFL